MSTEDSIATNASALSNGSGAAAILAAGIGCFMVAIFALVADKAASFKSAMIFYKPTGPLSGVTTSAILVWLVAWIVLNMRWRGRTVALAKTNAAALVLLALGLLLTFPPIVDLF